MTPSAFLTGTLLPGLRFLTAAIGPKPGGETVNWEDDAAGRLALLAFAGQETNWQNVAQIGGGPGRGPWQLGETTCADVMYNLPSEQMVLKVCAAAGILPTPPTIYDALMTHPLTIGVALPRLLLRCDDNPLPAYGDEDACWACYLRVWRPGSPSRQRWSVVYPQALAADRAYQQEEAT